MFYLDTSIMVAALTAGREAPRVHEWLAAQPVSQLHVSDWVVTEFSSAVSIKLRTGQIDVETKEAALSEFRKAAERSLHVLPVSRMHFQLAAHMVERHELGLRAADALHLALAAERGLIMCTLGRRLATAAAALGQGVVVP
jgi:uncharacterized protein